MTNSNCENNLLFKLIYLVYLTVLLSNGVIMFIHNAVNPCSPGDLSVCNSNRWAISYIQWCRQMHKIECINMNNVTYRLRHTWTNKDCNKPQGLWSHFLARGHKYGPLDRKGPVLALLTPFYKALFPLCISCEEAEERHHD